MQKLLVSLVTTQVCLTPVWGTAIRPLRAFCLSAITRRASITHRTKTDAYLVLNNAHRDQLPDHIAAVTTFRSLPAGSRFFVMRDMGYSTSNPTRVLFQYRATFVPSGNDYLFGSHLMEFDRGADFPFCSASESRLVDEVVDIPEARLITTRPFRDYTAAFDVTAETLTNMALELRTAADFRDCEKNKALLALSALRSGKALAIVQSARRSLQLIPEDVERHLFGKEIPKTSYLSGVEIQNYGVLCELARYVQRSEFASQAASLVRQLLLDVDG